MLLAVLAVSLTAVGVIATAIGPREPVQGNWESLVLAPTSPLAQVFSTWQRFDALWYQHIAQDGYHVGDGSSAFYPLYPLVARMLSVYLFGSMVGALLLVSFVACFGALWLLWRLDALETSRELPVAPRRGDTAATGTSLSSPTLTVLLFALFPTGFFLFAPYTESLFVALVVGSFWCLRTQRVWVAGVLGLLAAITRTQGAFMALPIAYEVLMSLRTARMFDELWWKRAAGLFAAAMPLLGTAGFMGYQQFVVGEHAIGLNALALWGFNLVAPWQGIGASIGYIATPNKIPGAQVIEAINLVSLVVFVGVSVAGFRRLPLSYWLYAWPSLALLLFRNMYFSPLMSVARYCLVVFPCFMVASRWLAGYPRLAAGILAISALGEVVLLQYFVRWGFVG